MRAPGVATTMAGRRLSRRACFGGEMPPTIGATQTPTGFATACRCSDTWRTTKGFNAPLHASARMLWMHQR